MRGETSLRVSLWMSWDELAGQTAAAILLPFSVNVICF